jgi:glycosyltransferase involved in cell wall biosynthesis
VPEKRPKLLFVVTLAEVGGAQSYVCNLLPAVRERFDVTVAAYGEGPLKDAAAALGIPFVGLDQLRRPLSPRDVLGLLELIRLFRRLRPDIVHLNSSKAGVIGRLAAFAARVPACVFTVHGWAFKADAGPSSRLYLWADRAVRDLADSIVCVSATELRAGLAARVCTARQATVIPNAVDVGPPPPPRPRSRRPVELVSVGRLAAPKDFPTLIAALALLPRGEARLVVLGDGPLRPALEREIDAHGLREQIELVGEVRDVTPHLRNADVFVLASRSEGMPMSILEAMATALPVVASDVGGVHEVVDDGVTGFLVPPGDPSTLAERLGRLVGDGALRAAAGAAARRRVEERFALPGWRARHVELYESLL